MRLPIKILPVLFILFSYTALSQDTVINAAVFEDYIDIHQSLKVWEPNGKPYTPGAIDSTLFKSTASFITEKNFFQRRLYLLEISYKGEEALKTVYFYPGKMVNVGILRLDSIKGWVPFKSFTGATEDKKWNHAEIHHHSGIEVL
jgi:hypothetical protein